MNNEEKILEILTQMQSDISSLKQGQISLEQGQISLEQGQKSLESKVDTIESKVDVLQKDMTEVKDNVRCLWEDYKIQEKRIDKIAK